MKFCLRFHWSEGWGGNVCRRLAGHAGGCSVHADPGTMTEHAKHIETCDPACNGRCKLTQEELDRVKDALSVLNINP